MGLKKSLGAAALAAGIGAAAIGGGTFALFSAEASNDGNTFTAGTVEISDVTGGAAFSSSTLIGNLAPGDSESATLTIENTGNLDAWVKINEASTNANGVANDGTGDLFEGSHPVSITHDTAAVLIPANSSHTFNVGYNFSLDAGNEYQGDTGEVTFEVKAVQARNNTNAAEDGPVAW